MSSILEIEEQLARLRAGERPAYAGPAALYSFFNQRRIRQLNEEREELLRRRSLWKGPRKPKCRGPSVVEMAFAQIASYLFVFLFFGAIFVFLLWYTGILAYILWLVNAIRKVIGFFVSLLTEFIIN